MYQNLVYLFVAIFGLSIGSFLNALIYRLPRKISLTWQRSICPSCKTQLHWYHNIPLVSYVVLRGKCGFCGKPIGWRYPFVEILNAAAYLFAYYHFGLSWATAIHFYLASALVAIIFIDLDFQIIPDAITLPGILLGIAAAFTPHGLGLTQSLTGMLVGGGSLYLVALLGDWLFKKESMGGGDIKMAAMLGAFLGWQKVLLIFMGSAVIGLLVSAIIMLFSEELRQKRLIPFGPFIAAAAVVALTYGDQIIHYYIAHFLAIR